MCFPSLCPRPCARLPPVVCLPRLCPPIVCLFVRDMCLVVPGRVPSSPRPRARKKHDRITVPTLVLGCPRSCAFLGFVPSRVPPVVCLVVPGRVPSWVLSPVVCPWSCAWLSPPVCLPGVCPRSCALVSRSCAGFPSISGIVPICARQRKYNH